jgi:ribosomal protein S11
MAFAIIKTGRRQFIVTDAGGVEVEEVEIADEAREEESAAKKSAARSKAYGRSVVFKRKRRKQDSPAQGRRGGAKRKAEEQFIALVPVEVEGSSKDAHDAQAVLASAVRECADAVTEVLEQIERNRREITGLGEETRDLISKMLAA